MIDQNSKMMLHIASANHWDDLPDFLDHALEIGRKYGPSYLNDLSTRLMSKHLVNTPHVL